MELSAAVGEMVQALEEKRVEEAAAAEAEVQAKMKVHDACREAPSI